MISFAKAIATVHNLFSDKMNAFQNMETYAARLASFDKAPSTGTKKRASNAKGAKALKWPHKTPSPIQLATAGFFFQPTASCSDNATCFVCQRSFDGWEENDDPIKEHLRDSPECGWAINVAIEQDVENGIIREENPLSARMIEARKSTFNGLWPHENKRGWTCKTQKMADAGWYYCPIPESDDFVKCAYCGLSLDGWEPKDNPCNEHQKRSPDCHFFRLTEGVKPTRTKKGRASKASRMSTQSSVTVMSESQSMIEDKAEEGDSALTSTSNMTISSSVPKTSRKGPKVKKEKASKRLKTRSSKTDEVVQTGSFVEPEDDTFEIKIDAVGSKSTRGRKRKSAEMELNAVDDNSTSQQPPPVKQRGTRMRSSTVKPQAISHSIREDGDHGDVSVADADVNPPTIVPASKKKGKGGRKRASSTVRKASNTSAASTAPLRDPVLENDEIDAALEAELERPLTDDEVNDNMSVEEKPHVKRLTRTRQSTRKASASVAPQRKGKGGRKAQLAEETALQGNAPDEGLIEYDKVDDKLSPSQHLEEAEAINETAVETDVDRESVLPDAESSILIVTRSEPSIVELPPPEPEESPITHVQQQRASIQEENERVQPEPRITEDQPPMSKTSIVPSPTPSPQSSDIENYPPSSRPSQTRPPLVQLSPSKTQTIRIPLATCTPTTSPSKRMAASRLQTTHPWTSVDLDGILHGSPASRKQDTLTAPVNAMLSSPQKKMTVEEWIYYNAQQGEERLRNECERLVGILEDQGVQAMLSLEGVESVE